MPWQWIACDGGFAVRKLPTRHGPLDFLIRAAGAETIHMEIADTMAIPPGGLRIIPPLPDGMRIREVIAERGDCVCSHDGVQVLTLPCVADLRLGP
jgi:hypothetical protein